MASRNLASAGRSCGRRRWCGAGAGVTARTGAWRTSIAVVLSKGPCRSLYATYIQLVATRLDGAEDKVKTQVGIVLIKTQLKIRCLSVIGEIHHAPFNVKDAIGRAARRR